MLHEYIRVKGLSQDEYKQLAKELGLTRESKEKVEEDSKQFLGKSELEELKNAWEIVGSQDDDPKVRTMSDDKVAEIEAMIEVAEQEYDEPDEGEPDASTSVERELDRQRMNPMRGRGTTYSSF